MIPRKKEKAFDELSINAVGNSFDSQALWDQCFSKIKTK